MKCIHCEKEFIQRNKKHIYCSKACNKKSFRLKEKLFPNREKRIVMLPQIRKCIQCGKETSNPKYCSRSCSAIHNNHNFPKRKTDKLCVVCGGKVKNYKHKRCSIHQEEYIESIKIDYTQFTIGEYRNKILVGGRHPSWLNSHISGFARSWFKELTKLPCAKCGYSKHVELCHIKPISTFSDDSLLSEVNAKDNIIQLCPNCHWEMDHLEEIIK